MVFENFLVGDFLRVNLNGDLLGIHEEEVLLATVEQYSQEQGIVKCLADLTGVRYMNSTGLSFLIRIHSLLTAQHGMLVLINLSDQVSKLLYITKLDKIFEICASEAEAVQVLAGGKPPAARP